MERNYNRIRQIDKCIVFIDFDNTITTRDILDDMLLRFSKDVRWAELEKEWETGKIGSRECLRRQMKGIRISKRKLDLYLSNIRLDPYFKRLAGLLNAQKIKMIVLSDNFDYILKRILRANGVRRLQVYSNKLRFNKDRLLPIFPFSHKNCRSCGHCKKKNLLANADKESIIFYIGDGHSDICPAKYADIVFAKKDLLRYLKNKKHACCLPFKSLRDIYDYFKRIF